MPLPNTHMIHPRWQEHVAPVTVGGMQAQVRLSRPAGLGTRNPVTGVTSQIGPRTYYEGPGRVQNRGGVSPAGSEAGREVATGNYLVAVPIDVDAEPLLGDLVDVLDSPDPLQAGLRLYVVDVPTATQILQRNLGAALYPPTTNGKR